MCTRAVDIVTCLIFQTVSTFLDTFRSIMSVPTSYKEDASFIGEQRKYTLVIGVKYINKIRQINNLLYINVECLTSTQTCHEEIGKSFFQSRIQKCKIKKWEFL